MNYEESCTKIRKELASFSKTKAEDWFLCLKARFGMALVFEAIRDQYRTGSIITTPYTCITAINPILVAGLTPIYHDINPGLLSTGKPEEKYLKSNTRAIVMQHTLGIISDKNNIRRFADKHNLLVIEDAAHCITRMARDKDNKIIADISAHSFGVEKILTGTKFGGAIYLNPRLKATHPELYERIVEKFNKLKQPNRHMAFRMRSYKVSNAIVQRLHGKMRQRVRSLEIKTGLLEPAIYPFEQDGHQDEPCKTNKFVNDRILGQLETLKSNYIRRSANVDLYHSKLRSKHFKKITKVHEPLLAFPIVFENAQKANQAYDMLTSHGYFIRRWYSPLIYPGPNSLKIYRYKPSTTPLAEDISKRILCLPTDHPIIETNKIIELLTDKSPVWKTPVENRK